MGGSSVMGGVPVIEDDDAAWPDAASRFSPCLRVTDPYIPPRDEVDALFDGVWSRGWLTNEGPLVQDLTGRLRRMLGVEHMELVASGTSALQVALAALGITGSVVLTSFSYAATAHAVIRHGARPIFADIDAESFCLDPRAAEAAIAPDTTAILATHVYGLPCDHAALSRIAERHGVALIYDAAHAFGSTLKGDSLLALGDAAATSFHATKIFHTVEGGAVVMRDRDDDRAAALMKRHGIDGDAVPYPGINAKMSELHAAVGLAALPAVPGLMARRRARYDLYRARLADAPLRMPRPEAYESFAWNYAYCPVVFETAGQTVAVQDALAAQGIETRRYFRPALTKLDHLDKIAACPVAEDLSERVLCLPFGASLTEEQVETVAAGLLAAL